MQAATKRFAFVFGNLIEKQPYIKNRCKAQANVFKNLISLRGLPHFRPIDF